jgi:hypothetical protein
MDAPRIAAAALALAAMASLPARAALGGAADSVQADATALKSQVAQHAVTQTAYTVQRLTADNGTVVDEYLSSAGKVFALHWSGPRPPDLSQLLGSYFSEYQAVATQPHLRSSQVQVDTANMSYRAGGHMRAFWGTAWVPALLPAGLSLGDLK